MGAFEWISVAFLAIGQTSVLVVIAVKYALSQSKINGQLRNRMAVMETKQSKDAWIEGAIDDLRKDVPALDKRLAILESKEK